METREHVFSGKQIKKLDFREQLVSPINQVCYEMKDESSQCFCFYRLLLKLETFTK